MSDLLEKVKNAKAKKIAESNKTKPEAPAKKNKAKKPAEPPKEEPKPQPKKAALTGKLSTTTHRNGTAFTEKRPGVCAIIIRCWRSASEKKPMPKAQVVETIMKELEGRDLAKTTSLVAGAPSWLLTYNGIKVSSATTTDGKKGYWIPDSETEEVVAERLKKIRAK